MKALGNSLRKLAKDSPICDPFTGQLLFTSSPCSFGVARDHGGVVVVMRGNIALGSMEKTARLATPPGAKQLHHIFPTLPSSLLEMIMREVCLFVISYLLSGYM